MKILPGRSFPLGATIQNNGVNFSVFSPEAEKVELLLFENKDDINPAVIPFDHQLNKSYNYWHVFIEGIGVNQLYGYRVYGEYNPEGGNWFDGTKVLVDPYAKAIVGEYDRKLAQHYGEDNLHSCLKGAVISDDFDWGKDNYINHPISKSLIYEMHLAGFTKNINSGLPEKVRGTYKGLIEKIPYLKDLGITAVELLPVYAFDKQDAPNGKENYWGYSPINFFAIHAEYAAAQTPQEIVNEFKSLVKTLQENGIEVLLDVVYNHTTENDGFRDGPTLCLRGFANSSYYLLEKNGAFKNFSGTGNTLNGNHSVVRRMIMDSLKYWRQEMHIDGFRFDLASVLSRDEDGIPLQNPPILWSIDSHPALANAKIIAEPWDAVGLHQVTSFAGDRWSIWNDDYRDTIRKFVKGDENQIKRFAKSFLGSEYELNARHVDFKPHQNIHFVTCHDGFTMNDLVSYNKKHNMANGENNRDGNSVNHSWNCGVEGETDNTQINTLRQKQIKNFFAILLLSHGTPMLNMGDELRRSQSGNNNVYCQDNPLAWMNWEENPESKETLKLVKDLISFRKKHRLFSYPNYYKKAKRRTKPYVLFHGVSLNQPDWRPNSHSLAIEMVHPTKNEHLFLIFNMFHESLTFQLPNGEWHIAFDTDASKGDIVQGNIKCPSRTVMVLERLN
ncbi:glycogen debranching protein GlgX [Flavobacteriaceae bacterium Ap0902]|nr:glycogen debranching protein GlgX [Flavobacteriaceae bacterium Ap0902]